MVVATPSEQIALQDFKLCSFEDSASGSSVGAMQASCLK